MRASADRGLLFVLVFAFCAGCAHTPPVVPDLKPAGVTANSGGDTRGTILYQPAPPLPHPPDPYTVVSSKIVLPQRQKIAWELAEIDSHAHQQAANAFPVPEAGSTSYLSRSKSRDAAEQQAVFNAYLLEKYRARFCNQFHLTYDEIALITQEGRDKNWPMPPPPEQ